MDHKRKGQVAKSIRAICAKASWGKTSTLDPPAPKTTRAFLSAVVVWVCLDLVLFQWRNFMNWESLGYCGGFFVIGFIISLLIDFIIAKTITHGKRDKMNKRIKNKQAKQWLDGHEQGIELGELFSEREINRLRESLHHEKQKSKEAWMMTKNLARRGKELIQEVRHLKDSNKQAWNLAERCTDHLKNKQEG